MRKRENYRLAFDGFDPGAIARYDECKLGGLLADPGIVRNRLKLASAVINARAFLDLREQRGSFDEWLWRFVGGRVRQNCWRNMAGVPASTAESDAMSKALAKRGFKFVGGTICYAFMQAAGMVNDHTMDCFRQRELR